MRIDSGFLDSHWDLGLNAPASKRIQTKITLHCAPLQVANHKRSSNRPLPGLLLSYDQYFYGESLFGEKFGRNFTYMLPKVDSGDMSIQAIGSGGNPGYTLGFV